MLLATSGVLPGLLPLLGHWPGDLVGIGTLIESPPLPVWLGVGLTMLYGWSVWLLRERRVLFAWLFAVLLCVGMAVPVGLLAVLVNAAAGAATRSQELLTFVLLFVALPMWGLLWRVLSREYLETE